MRPRGLSSSVCRLSRLGSWDLESDLYPVSPVAVGEACRGGSIWAGVTRGAPPDLGTQQGQHLERPAGSEARGGSSVPLRAQWGRNGSEGSFVHLPPAAVGMLGPNRCGMGRGEGQGLVF